MMGNKGGLGRKQGGLWMSVVVVATNLGAFYAGSQVSVAQGLAAMMSYQVPAANTSIR